MKKDFKMKWAVLAGVLLSGICLAGCGVSKTIVDLTPPAHLPPLERLEDQLNAPPPAASQPSLFREAVARPTPSSESKT